MAKRERACIFCGKSPENKNLEHILPRWLIKHTGDPKRVVYHGMHFGSSPSEMRPKIFAFDSFRFPACEACNSRWAILETEAKSAIISLENGELVTELQLSALFDWFDKVRVGLWLARQMDGSSIARVDPKFHIDQRVGASDRLLFISRGAEAKALTTLGVGGAVFGFMPSVFALRINSLMFFNASSISLFAYRLGFPRIFDRRVNLGGQVRYEPAITPETGQIRRPLMQLSYALPALKLYQPMYRYLAMHPHWQQQYRTPYVLENSLDWSTGEGVIFTEHGNTVERAINISGKDYDRMNVDEGRGLLDKVHRSISLWQRQLSKSGVRGDVGTPERKAEFARTLEKARRLDKIFDSVSRRPSDATAPD